MTSSLHRWESDPLFSAAEVVQDSADRMESIYCLLLHEQSLVLGDCPDSRLLTSINYHRRDLATIIDMTKWQLEDFERAVSMSVMMSKPQTTEDVIVRHGQFIGAIREQINQVEKSLEDTFVGKSLRNSEWVNLNKQDRDGLALFLSGGNPPPENVSHHDAEDSSILRRFIDPNSQSSSQDDGIIEHRSIDTESLKMNGFVHAEHYYSSEKENNSRNIGFRYSTGLGFDTLNSLQETSCSRRNEDRSCDLEANEITPKSFFHENKLRGRYSRRNIFRYLKNLLSAYGSGITRNYTKRLKDGEERNFPSHIDVSHAAQGQHMGISLTSRGSCLHEFCIGFAANAINLCLRLWAFTAICQRFPYHFQVNQHSVRMILAAIFTLTVLGILVSQIA